MQGGDKLSNDEDIWVSFVYESTCIANYGIKEILLYGLINVIKEISNQNDVIMMLDKKEIWMSCINWQWIKASSIIDIYWKFDTLALIIKGPIISNLNFYRV